MSCLLVLCATLAPSLPAQIRSEGLIQYLPSESVICIEGPGLMGFLEEGFDHPFVRSILDSKFGDEFYDETKVTPEQAVAFVEGIIGMPFFSTAGELVSDGVVLGVERYRGEPVFTLLARSEDDALWEQILHQLIQMAVGNGDLSRDKARSREGVGGAEIWSMGKDLTFAHLDGAFVVSSLPRRVDQVLARLAGETEDGLLVSEGWAAERATRSRDALLTGWIDLDGIRELANGGGELGELFSMNEQPAVQMLLGSGVALLGQARALSMQLTLSTRSIGLSMDGLGIEAGAAAALFPNHSSAKAELPKPTSDQVASLVAYRDLGGVFAKRADLFPPDVVPAFARVSNELAPILGGLDLGEDILPGLSPWIRAVVREVEFDESAVPELPLPAVAFLLDLEDPEKLGPLLASSFQTAVTLVSVERAQQGKQPMMLFLEEDRGIFFSAARLLAPRSGDGVDIGYNLVPACAVVDDTFVLGSHIGVVRDVARQIRTKEMSSVADDRDELIVSSAALVKIVRANSEALVMNGVLEGKPREQVETELEALVELMGLFEKGRLTTRYDSTERVVVELDLHYAQAQ